MSGTVYLVGAGPGDPGLMTRRSLDLIASADAILYDRLIPPGALDGARPDADLRYVGKQPGGHSMDQEDINALLVELGSRLGTVVRLKGGDPFVFGRGGEEAQALADAGIPVTHRDDASAVALITGHEDPTKPESALDWPALAAFPGTLVLYMGVRNLPRIASQLVAGGRPSDEPVAVIERGTLPGQRTVSGTLTDIAERVAEAGLKPPAITLVGPVARLRERLEWLERRPLFGRSVVVTRARAQASGLAARLAALGAQVIEAPAIRIEPRPAAEVDPVVERIGDFVLVCVTSPNGASLLFEALHRTGRDARALAGTTVAAIGPGTAAELSRGGIRADVVPPRSIAESLVEALEDVPVEGKRVLVARAAEARDLLPDALRARGAEVEVLPLYDTVAEPLAEPVTAADYVTFTSSSTVRFFLESNKGGVPDGARVVSIGPVTSATARELGLQVDVEATQHDVDGLIAA
ncbi:MAG: uroporphyrinogen methyltransferase / synthase, partial [Solirubrobacteraceae bacterium]|nr:uroporphyrinogen methyltransferase / synthase [Solirubrobacteraceae bacterium]